MAEDVPSISTSRLVPADVARHSFGTARRGFDPQEVRSYLELVARELSAWEQREQDLRRQLAEAEERLRHPVIDESMLTSALGQQTAQVLRNAHEEAARVTRQAEEASASLVHEAQSQAAELRVQAEAGAAERIAQAELAVGSVHQQAEEEAARLAEVARAEGEALATRAREQGQALIDQAQETRRRVLADMAQRRRAVSLQIEQFRAARDELAVAVLGVRDSVDRIVDGLSRADDEARAAAADVARRQPPAPPEAVLAEEIEPVPDAPALREAAVPSPSGAAVAGDVLAPPAGGAVAADDAPPGDAVVAERSADGGRAGAPATAYRAPGEAAGDALPGGATGEAAGDAPPAPPDDAVAAAPGDAAEVPAAGARGAVAHEGPAAGDAVPGEGAAQGEQAAGESGPGGEADAVEGLFARLRASHPGDGEPGAVPPAAGTAGVDDDDVRPGDDVGRAKAGSPRGDVGRSDDVRPGDDVGRVAPGTPGGDAPGTAEKGAVPAGDGPRAAAATGEAGAGAAAAGAGDATGAPGASDAAGGADAAGGVGSPEDPVRAMGAKLLDPVVGQLARRVKRALQDDQNALLDRLRSGPGGWSADLLAGEDEQRAHYAAAAGPSLREAAAAGTAFARAQQGARGRAPAPDEKVVAEAADGLARAVVAQLRRRLGEQEPDDGNAASAADRVGAAYREWRGERIERLVGDCALGAFSDGVLAASKRGAAVRWVLPGSGPGCADCDDNALAGTVVPGEEFPTGHRRPPVHAGCRCLVVPTPA